MRRAVRILLAAVVVVAILLLFVLPGRTLLSQERTLTATQAQIHALSSENQKLTRRAADLQSDSEIERIAREYYGLVKPGEQAVAIIPPTATTTTTTLPAARPRHRGGFWQSLQFWH